MLCNVIIEQIRDVRTPNRIENELQINRDRTDMRAYAGDKVHVQ
jgi:hypothetical protein